jgi:ABC-2 type transport system permease protein
MNGKMENATVANRGSALMLALKDIRDGVLCANLWALLGWQEIRQRYRRSIIGPFWITISTGVMIVGMGPLYGRLFGQDLGNYFPYLAVSFVTWQFISNLVNDCSNAFILSGDFIKQVKMPLTVYVMRAVWKNTLIFSHNLILLILVFLFFPPVLGWHLLTFPIAIFFIGLNAVWFGILVGLLSARFRDIPLIVTSFTQIAFFLTPVMWKAGMLGDNIWLANINPLFHFIEIIRGPILMSGAAVLSWMVVFGVTIFGFLLMVPIFARYRARIAYWV